MIGAPVTGTLSGGNGTSLKPFRGGTADTFARSTQAPSMGTLLGISVELPRAL
jgi:hypothetical protein